MQRPQLASVTPFIIIWLIYPVFPAYFLRKCMMLPSSPTLAQTEAVDIIITILAIIVTSFRLYVRVRQRRLWIDDAWAALGMTFNFILLVALCLYLQDFEKYPQNMRVALYYIFAQCFYVVLW
ncbi:hypothetical protein BDR07DRAFT_431933 [Suillus spraguei]|nr:hypothetical protein BDR07DRAFT_431933 [Suillus spraguei]